MVDDKKQSELLVKNGFISPKHRHKYKKNDVTGKYEIVDSEKYGSLSPDHADEEEAEEVNLSATPKLFKTGYPRPFNRYRLISESFNMSLEETYYWFLNHLRQDQGFPRVDKIIDVFSASENSAFFGQSAQRLSIQEDRASSFLRGISELVRQLFQIVRELRIIDERLVPYSEWVKEGKDGKLIKSKSADVTLKGIFADFAENKGGQMQPGSLYHLAQTVGYASLPDLFFNTHVYRKEDVDKIVDSMKSFNNNVRNVLKRKLYQFIVWKEKTEKELRRRRQFQIRYLRQHWATIKMYMAWTRPYLRHIKRLTMNENQLDSPDLIGAFETSMTEVEILAVKPLGKGMNACVLATFQFNTRPIMQYRQEYQQGPVHVGRVTVTLRAYGWTDEQIKNYNSYRMDEDFQLIGLVDESLRMAMDELAEDLEKYLNEEGKRIFDEDVHSKFGSSSDSGSKSSSANKPSMSAKPSKAKVLRVGGSAVEPFVALFGGLWELFSALIPINFKKPSKSPKPKFDDGASKKAAKAAEGAMWQAYKNYKKSHGMLAW